MNVPFLDLKQQYLSIKEEIDRAIAGVLESCNFILGEPVKELEERLAHYCGVKHGVAVASGTDALYLSLKACGIGPGDEVITSSYSFFASAGTIWNAGAKPVFVDIDPGTFNLDVFQAREKITGKTKALMPVHLFGQCADMAPLLEVAKDFGLAVIEDAAQAVGATYQGKRAGSMGTAGCFSFYPSKNLGAYGDGGMVVTDDASIADKVRLLRVHGAKPKYFHKVTGINSRLDAIQAALLRVCLKKLDVWNSSRRQVAAWYDAGLKGISQLKTPKVLADTEPVYHLYVVMVPDREALAKHLKEKGIESGVHYPYSLNVLPAFTRLGQGKGHFPKAEYACEHMLSLPVSPTLTKEEIEYVCETIRNFYK